mgnify:FL=1
MKKIKQYTNCHGENLTFFKNEVGNVCWKHDDCGDKYYNLDRLDGFVFSKEEQEFILEFLECPLV